MELVTKNNNTVYPIALGTMGLSGIYSPIPTREQAIELLCQAIDFGYNLLDSAIVYGQAENGTSEKLIAAAIERLNDRQQTNQLRESLFISTKGGLTFQNGNFAISGKYHDLKADFTASLLHLDTDYIDCYFLHRIDPKTPLTESLQYLAELKCDGKIRYIGISEIDKNTMETACEILAKYNSRLDVIQNEYSLINRVDEFNETLDFCRQQDIAYMAYSPIGRGLVANQQAREQTFQELDSSDIRCILPRYTDYYQKNSALINQLEIIAQQLNVNTVQIALSWLLQNAGQLGVNLYPIVGTRSPKHLQTNYIAGELELTVENFNKIADLMDPQNVLGNRWPAEIKFSSRVADPETSRPIK